MDVISIHTDLSSHSANGSFAASSSPYKMDKVRNRYLKQNISQSVGHSWYKACLKGGWPRDTSSINALYMAVGVKRFLLYAETSQQESKRKIVNFFFKIQ